MKVRNVVHKGLRRFAERDKPSGLPPDTVEKVRNIATFLLDMKDIRELRGFRHWKAHQLTGDHKGTWSLAATKNWRITFSVDKTEGEIVDLDFEDYH